MTATAGSGLEVAIDDREFVIRVTRLRAVYAELVPGLAGLLAAASGNEAGSVMRGRRRERAGA